MDVGQYSETGSQPQALDDILAHITSQPKKQYSQKEIDEARGKLALMNDRVFWATFADNKNNDIVKGIADSLRKIHGLADIPQIVRTTVQSASLLDVLGRGMVGDLLGEGEAINLAIEAQKEGQSGFAVRGTLSSSNAMRIQFNAGDDFTDAPDVIGINILGFRLPELANHNMFVSRIVRSNYDTGETFLADKYSDYYIEIPKMTSFSKTLLPKEYHDLWDLCCIIKSKVNEHEEVIRMQAVANPVAINLSQEVRKTVAPNDFVAGTLDRTNELEQLREYISRRDQKTALKTAEDMLVSALQANVPPDAIESMRKRAGISETRLAELKHLAQLQSVV